MNFKLFRSLTVACAALFFASCDKKDLIPQAPYECTSCVNTPEANAMHDNSTKGIYKGFVIASTGTIKFNIDNNGTGISAVMVLDGQTVNLTSSVTWEDGEPYVAPFTGTLNGNPVSITFSVDVSGQNPTITASNIPGHPNATIVVVKETSFNLIETFEGTYSVSDGETGKFNILMARSMGYWGGASREDGTTDTEQHGGYIINNVLMEDQTTIGVLAGDNINGSFTNADNHTVTVTGRRTL